MFVFIAVYNICQQTSISEDWIVPNSLKKHYDPYIEKVPAYIYLKKISIFGLLKQKEVKECAGKNCFNFYRWENCNLIKF